MHENNTEAPLSKLMGSPDETITAQRFSQVLDLFRRSEVGVIASGQPEGTSGPVWTTSELGIKLESTNHPDGLLRILAYADPEVFARKFGRVFNAQMSGDDLLRTALANPECQGILINSATDEASFCINRKDIEAMLGTGRRRPWWKFW